MAVAMLALTACGGNNNNNNNHGTHVHEDGTVHQDHATEAPATQESFKVEADTTAAEAEHHHDHGHTHGHEHEENLQLTAYNDAFEVFAEVTPMVVGQKSDILAHFTHLDNFKPLEQGKVTVSLIIGTDGIRQSTDSPSRPGIYRFVLTPNVKGPGKMLFEIETAEAVYNNMRRNFSSDRQTVQSPMRGYIQELLVRNGEYVESGQSLAVITKSNMLNVKAEIQPKHYQALKGAVSANFRQQNSDVTYSLEDLDGRLVSYGKSVSAENPLLPVVYQIRNVADFLPGSFIELYIRTEGEDEVITIPNTSLIEEMGNYFVYIQLTPEFFEKREVKIGDTDGVRTASVYFITHTPSV